MATEKAVCPHLHFPLQSGSDRVLGLMRRGYTAQRYLERLAAARAAVPDLAVTTDIIVGFPGEDEADFRRTLEVAAEAEYDSAYTFIYSPRPGTEAAARTQEFVPAEVVSERFERLRLVVERSALRRHEARVGLTEEVLVEGRAKKGGPGVFSGRTRQNKLVHLDAAHLRAGMVVEAVVEHAAPHFLKARLVRVISPPRHRPGRGPHPAGHARPDAQPRLLPHHRGRPGPDGERQERGQEHGRLAGHRPAAEASTRPTPCASVAGDLKISETVDLPNWVVSMTLPAAYSPDTDGSTASWQDAGRRDGRFAERELHSGFGP